MPPSFPDSASLHPGYKIKIVVLAHLQSQRERNNPEGRLLGKLALIRRLYERGYTRQAILDLFRFIDWVLELPKDLELIGVRDFFISRLPTTIYLYALMMSLSFCNSDQTFH